ncbi:hypothetical protein E5676_scaffold105G001200 [Cucumis melo var. makuwa]|uniref:Uncharacterized protein n=1 Tax=Cucumis melo var. makuwa TaxID=1194695 RepID=A0A5D3C8T6_CUCMM|nr:hypothetical protein E6C27_scaffold13G001390 [Cucumis melo var. makuwa]TYK07702.1 hypothetical protein E5676_scaffold105G001200 [Cucumis melo var. makuwa]
MSGDSTVSDQTSTGGRSDFCRQIHRSGRSDRTPSFKEVTSASVIQLLLGDDRALAIRFTALVGAIGHHRRLERDDFAIRDLTSIGDDRTLAVRSTTLIHHPGRSDRAPLSFEEVTPPSAI